MHFPAGIIPARAFLQFRINFSDGNHPYKTFPANQDAFSRWKSSLQELFSISGCISPAGIIPTRAFQHNQDAFPRWKSSLQELFCKSGSISPTEIIPTRLFLQIRMHFPAGNHPYKSFFAIQDAFPRRKSSLQDNSTESG